MNSANTVVVKAKTNEIMASSAELAGRDASFQESMRPNKQSFIRTSPGFPNSPKTQSSSWNERTCTDIVQCGSITIKGISRGSASFQQVSSVIGRVQILRERWSFSFSPYTVFSIMLARRPSPRRGRRRRHHDPL